MVYKLYYFDVKFLAEPARMILHAAGQDFEDITWPMAEWEEWKKKSPTGKAPWLEVDGHVIPESTAINRFLGNRFGFSGKDDLEKALVDSTADFVKDTWMSAREYFQVVGGRKEGDLEKIKKEVLDPALKTAFDYIKNKLDESKSGFIAPSGLTWVDFWISVNILLLNEVVPDFKDEFGFALEYQNRVHNHPKVKDYAESRKDVRIGYLVKPKK
ncbi:hypothetical protein FO519_008030 [Halicephalobus sp. NKZ332]|nr:hypothetical protein FO519_008030 [Halicephalobus sp. NKZ332]